MSFDRKSSFTQAYHWDLHGGLGHLSEMAVCDIASASVNKLVTSS